MFLLFSEMENLQTCHHRCVMSRTLTGSHHNTYTGDELVAMLAHQLKMEALGNW